MPAYPGISPRGSVWRRTLIGEALLCLVASLAAAGAGTLGAGLFAGPPPSADEQPGIRGRASFHPAPASAAGGLTILPAAAAGAAPGGTCDAPGGCCDAPGGCPGRAPAPPAPCGDDGYPTCAAVYMTTAPASEAPAATREI